MVHIYYGDGKGKTTAAIGLGVRACGAGLKTDMVQFLKTEPTGELQGIAGINGFTIYRFESPHGFLFSMTEEEKTRLQEETQAAMRFALQSEADLLILDEVLDAAALGLLPEESLLQLIRMRGGKETVLTGHTLPESLADSADYITEMKKHRHPYDQGTAARKGIEY